MDSRHNLEQPADNHKNLRDGDSSRNCKNARHADNVMTSNEHNFINDLMSSNIDSPNKDTGLNSLNERVSTTSINATTATLSVNTSYITTDINVHANPSQMMLKLEQNESNRNHKCSGNMDYKCNVPSTSGVNIDSSLIGSGDCRENRKRPSSLKLNRSNLLDDSSSDTGNDDYSLGSEDGCIYTYRGGQHSADLPSSFFSLDMGLPLNKHIPLPPNFPIPEMAPPNVRGRGSRASSPDMDFLEMDFDPGPSCEVDTGDESTPDADLDAANMPIEEEPVLRGTSPEYVEGIRHNLPLVDPSTSQIDRQHHYHEMPSTSRCTGNNNLVSTSTVSDVLICGPYITHVNARGENFLVRRTMSHWPSTSTVSVHVSSGDLVSPREILNYEEDHPESQFAYQINQGERTTLDPVNISSALYHLTMAKKLIADKALADNKESDEALPVVVTGGSNDAVTRIKLTSKDQSISKKISNCIDESKSETASRCVDEAGPNLTPLECVEPPRCMVWSVREACERQVTQIATSACGATAVVNVFIALGVPVNIEKINSAIGTRQRANSAPLPRYLLSRAVAGCTAAELVSGIQAASDGLVTARFFPTYPERAVSLSHWLADWISLGAVPVLTLNLQVGCEDEIPDAWHHQMVFGVSSRGVYLCNPAECVPETTLWPRLISPSVLLVKTRDILTRFTPTTDLTPLMMVPDSRFHTFNVLGQVATVIREWRSVVCAGCAGYGSCVGVLGAVGSAGAVGSTMHCPAGMPGGAGIRTTHIRIPAAYQAGITIAALTGSEAHRRLVHANQLPTVSVSRAH